MLCQLCELPFLYIHTKQISSRRIVDNIPIIIRLHMFKHLSQNIRKQVTRMTTTTEAADLIKEDDEMFQQRKVLKDRISQLDEAERKLNKFY